MTKNESKWNLGCGGQESRVVVQWLLHHRVLFKPVLMLHLPQRRLGIGGFFFVSQISRVRVLRGIKSPIQWKKKREKKLKSKKKNENENKKEKGKKNKNKNKKEKNPRKREMETRTKDKGERVWECLVKKTQCFCLCCLYTGYSILFFLLIFFGRKSKTNF